MTAMRSGLKSGPSAGNPGPTCGATPSTSNRFAPVSIVLTRTGSCPGPTRLTSGRHHAAAPSRTSSAPVVHEIDRRERLVRRARALIRVPERDQLCRRPIRQRPQQHGVDDGVDGHPGAGAEPEHEHGDERERRVLAELAQRETKGVQHGETPEWGHAMERRTHRRSDRIAESPVGPGNRAELRFVERRTGALARLGLGRALRSPGLVEIFEMRGQFVDRMDRQVGAGLARLAPDDLAPVGHGLSERVLTPATRPSATMNRAQSSRCAARTRRPVGNPVVAAPSLAGLLDPAPAQPAAILEPVQRCVERGERELHRPVGPRLDLPRDLVAVEA